MSDQYNEILKDFSELAGDYRGEVFAAELIKNGLPYDRIYFKTLSVFRRPTSKDIEAIKLNVNGTDADQVILELNREGLYDMMPEGLFHFKDLKNIRKDKDGVLNNIKQNRKEEKFARKFFGPFENEFFQLRLQVEMKKRALLQPGSVESNLDFFESIFGDSSLLNENQILALLYILPITYKVRGNLPKIAYCISTLIRYKTEIKLDKSSFKEQFNGKPARLGEARLGVDSVVGTHFQSFYTYYHIHVRGIGKEKLTSFFPGGSNHSLIQYVCNFLFPAESKYQIKLHLKKSDRRAYLSNDENESFLGFNSYLYSYL